GEGKIARLAAFMVRRTPNCRSMLDRPTRGAREDTPMTEVQITFDAADDYERFMGRWSRAIGEKFLAWLDPPAGARWLDVGCGTGAFSDLIQRRCAPKEIVGIDPAPAQIDYAQKKFPALTFRVADSMDMP